jgi:O-methyltransferase
MNPIDALFFSAQSAHQQGDLSKAEKLYRHHLEQHPQYVDSLHLLGVLLGQNLNYAQAIPFLQKAATLAPERQDLHINLAHALHQAGQTQSALYHLKTAFDQHLPFCAALMERQGDLYAALENHAQAAAAYEKALALAPTQTDLHFKLAQIYIELRHYREAGYRLSVVLSLDPSHGFAKKQQQQLSQQIPPLAPFLKSPSPPQAASTGPSAPEKKPETLQNLYLNRLKQSLLDEKVSLRYEPDHHAQTEYLCWPFRAATMIGPQRLEHLHDCLEQIHTDAIAGDLIETGVWRGGATIFMRGFLEAYGDTQRKVWVADSFEGLPLPNPSRYPQDAGGLMLHQERPIKVSLGQVKTYFERYALLDAQVCFLEGFFKDTLPNAPIKQLALLRLDGDMYESTLDALQALYPKVSPGGYVIVDDYGAIPACRAAVTDYCKSLHITPEIKYVDHACVFWRKAL